MNGRRRALIVANDEYEFEGLSRLQAPSADAQALASVLGDAAIGDFTVQTVHNQPAHEVQAHIEDLFSDSSPDDVLLLHFSCHGLKSETGDLFFAARNTRPNRLGSTAVAADFVQRCMRASRSRSIVLLLDCCYGGAFSQGVTVRGSDSVNVLDSFPGGRLGGGRGRAVITASSSMEYAFEGGELADQHQNRPSVFTAALVEGLATGDADRDEDGLVSLNELYEYVFDRVREQNPNQTPSRDVEMQGELYLARSRRRKVASLPVPPDLQAAMADPNMFTRLGAVSELRARLNGENVPAAMGALTALTNMSQTDIQYVAEAAGEAVRDARVRVADPELDFGTVARGAAVEPRVLRLEGPPIARAGGVEASDPWIRVRDTEQGPAVSVDTSVPGPLRGTVTVKGPTGEVLVPVAVAVEASVEVPVEAPVEASVEAPAAAVAVEPVPEQAMRRTVPEEAQPEEAEPEGSTRRTALRRLGPEGVVGVIAMVGGLLMLLGLTAPFEWGTRLHDANSRAAVYVLLMGAVVLVAGACSIVPAVASRLGVGLLLGVSLVSTWGLVLFLSYMATEGSDGLELGFILTVTGHVLATAVGGLLLVRLRRRPPGTTRLVDTGRLGRLPVLLGVVGVVPLGYNASVWWGTDDPGLYLPALWLVLLALAVPTVAAVLVEPSPSVPVLLGWVAASATLVVYYVSLLREWGFSLDALAAFGLVLAVTVGVIATLTLRQRRRAPRAAV